VIENKWLSRSFFIALIALGLAFTLAWKLEDSGTFTVVATAVVTAWWGGKGIAGLTAKMGGASGGSG